MSHAAHAIVWTLHGRDRALERSGPSLRVIEDQICAAIRSGATYEPSECARRATGERWVACDGPRGRATAIIETRRDRVFVITVRDANSAGQGERAGVPLTATVADRMRHRDVGH